MRSEYQIVGKLSGQHSSSNTDEDATLVSCIFFFLPASDN